MILNYLRYRYVKARLAAYLDGELPDKTRRFIARQIDENPLAYREYLRARQTKQELERSLPSFGRADAGQLQAIWANIQEELVREEVPTRNLPLRPNFSLGYGFAVVIFVMLLLTPLLLNANANHYSVPSQPSPELLTTRPANTESIATEVAFIGSIRATDDLSLSIANTPAPETPRDNQ